MNLQQYNMANRENTVVASMPCSNWSNNRDRDDSSSYGTGTSGDDPFLLLINLRKDKEDI